MYFEKALPVGLTGGYSFTFSTNWLGGETINSATVTVPSAGATVVTTAIDGNVVGFRVTGVTVGNHDVHCEIQTATRSDCVTGRLTVNDC